jgi:hypothetical protein
MIKILLNSFLFIVMLLPVVSHSQLIGSGGPDSFSFNTLAEVIAKILKWFFAAAASIAAIGFAVSGIRMLINPENSSERTAAKENLKKTVIGLLIALTGTLIVQTIAKEEVQTPGATKFFQLIK